MLQTVSFCPCHDAEKIPADMHTVVISITSPGAPIPHLEEGFAAALQLVFDDVSYPMRGHDRNQMPISRSQVAEIVAFYGFGTACPMAQPIFLCMARLV